MDKVQKIREEVERLMTELIQKKEKGFGSDIDDACILELQNVLTFIDSLQEEPVSDELEEEIDNYVKRNGYDGLDSIEEVKYIANHFAEWQRNQCAKLPKLRQRDTIGEFSYQCAYDLSNDWARETPDWHDVEAACKLGAEWEEMKILEDAIEVPLYLDGDFLTVDYDFSEKGYKNGDKVKLIIIKDE